MQLGFVTAILPEMSFEEVLQVAAKIGYDCVEVMCWPTGTRDRKYGGVTHLEVESLTQTQADEILALCAKYGVHISALGYYPNPLSNDPKEGLAARQHLKKVIAAAPLLGLETVNTFIGADHTLSMQENLALFEELWPPLIAYAESKKVRIGIENCPMLFPGGGWPFGKNLARSPQVWRHMYAQIPSGNFGLNYDPSHMVLQLMDYLAPIQEFGPRIFHTHAKDMKIKRDYLNQVGCWAMDFGIPKIPGLGDIDWAAWISALTDIGYQGPVCVEVEDEAFISTTQRRILSLQISYNTLRPLIG